MKNILISPNPIKYFDQLIWADQKRFGTHRSAMFSATALARTIHGIVRTTAKAGRKSSELQKSITDKKRFGTHRSAMFSATAFARAVQSIARNSVDFGSERGA